MSPDVIEYAVYGAPGELPHLPDLRAAAAGALVDVRTEEIADDWAQRWRSFHRPLILGERLTVRPPWEPATETELDVVIDPAQAFGTGAHATTRLCLELMLELKWPERRGSFVDLGCGSGVLAISAAKLGWAPVTALDYDNVAVNGTLEKRSPKRRRPRRASLRSAARAGAGCGSGGGKHTRRPFALMGRVPASASALADSQWPACDRGRPGRRGLPAAGIQRARAPDPRGVGGSGTRDPLTGRVTPLQGCFTGRFTAVHPTLPTARDRVDNARATNLVHSADGSYPSPAHPCSRRL